MNVRKASAETPNFPSRWESTVLTQHKPSTQVTIRSHLRKHLIPYFGRWQMREVELEDVQRFVSSLRVGAKTAKNLFATMQMLWKSARAWATSRMMLSQAWSCRSASVRRGGSFRLKSCKVFSPPRLSRAVPSTGSLWKQGCGLASCAGFG